MLRIYTEDLGDEIVVTLEVRQGKRKHGYALFTFANIGDNKKHACGYARELRNAIRWEIKNAGAKRA